MKRISLMSFIMLLSLLAYAQTGQKQTQTVLPTWQTTGMNAVNQIARTANGQASHKIRKAEAGELVAPPAGVEVEMWEYLSGTYYLKYTSGWGDITSSSSTVKRFGVAFDGTDVYIQGLAYFFPQGWVKGSLSGNKVTVPAGQLVGEDGWGPEYLFGANDGSNVSVDIVFDYDAEQNTLSMAANMGAYECGEPTFGDEEKKFGYWHELAIRKPNASDVELVTPPADLETADMPLTGMSQMGNGVVNTTVKVGIDGQDVYIQGLVQTMPETWLKGQIEDGIVTFPIQPVGEYGGTTYWATGYHSYALVPMTLTYDAERNTYEAFGVLLVTSDKLTYDYYSLLDYYSGLYIGERPERVVAPTDLKTKDLPYSGRNAKSEKAEGTVKVGFDGNDVWFQGLFAEVPEGWFKGTLNEDKTEVTVAYGQYMGVSEKNSCNVYIIGDSYTDDGTLEVVDVKFSYDEKSNVFVSQNNIYVNNKPDALYYSDGLRTGLMIGTPIDATWIAGEQGYEDAQDVTEFTIGKGINAVAAQNNGQNQPKYYNSGEALRLYAGNMLTITSEKTMAKIVFTMTGNEKQMQLESDVPAYTLDENIGTWAGEANEVTFSVPETSGSQARIQRIDIYYYDYSSIMVEAPADLVTDDYTFVGDDNYGRTAVTKSVKVGFYGEDEVYMQGLSDILPDAWVKGRLTDGKLTIPNWYLGLYSSWYGDYEMVFSGANFTYDADADEFNGNGFTTVAVNQGQTLDDYVAVKIYKVTEVAAIPAQPTIDSYEINDNYDRIMMTIPKLGTEGEELNLEKLSYRLYIDIAGEVSDLVFTPSKYFNLAEDVIELPYQFTDLFDFYVGGSQIYIYDDNRGSWNKIGVKSIYRGLGEMHESEIFWYTIREIASGVDRAAVTETADDAPTYNLQGIRVNRADRKGVYVKNGRKFIQ